MLKILISFSEGKEVHTNLNRAVCACFDGACFLDFF